MAAAEDYVCTLDEASQRKAREELGEDEKERLGQVQTLREWVHQQRHLTAPTDTKTLLRHLRQGKFSQLRARESIEGWARNVSEVPRWCADVDVMNPKVSCIYKDGTCLPLPGRDNEGCKIFIMGYDRFDASGKRFKIDDCMKGFIGMMTLAIQDENVNVNGVKFFYDMTHMTTQHQTFVPISDFKPMVNCFMKRFPLRFKRLIYYNSGPIFEAMFAVFGPLMPEKIKSRIMMTSNMEKVYEVVPKHMLPREYLPDDYTGPCAGSLDDLIEANKAEMMCPKTRSLVQRETSSQFWGVDENKRQIVPSESFRKLNVD